MGGGGGRSATIFRACALLSGFSTYHAYVAKTHTVHIIQRLVRPVFTFKSLVSLLPLSPVGNWPLPKRVGTWVGINNAKALGIVWRTRTSKYATSLQLRPFLQPGTQQLYCRSNFWSINWSIDWILSLQTIPSAIAVLIPTQLPARFGNGQLAPSIFGSWKVASHVPTLPGLGLWFG